MSGLLKKIVVGSPLEPLARRVYGHLFNPELAQDLRYNRQTDQIMKRVLTARSNCVDVGCYRGVMLDRMLAMAPQGNHIAFEPIPQCYDDLVKKFQPHSNVTIHNLALCDTQGEATFHHVTSNPAYSGFKQRSYPGASESIQQISVKTDRLDDVIPPDFTIDFLKVDVEGAELQVFQGAVHTIQRTRPVIVFEHGLGAADRYGAKPEDLYDLLVENMGFKISLMQQWLHDETPLSRAAFCDEFHLKKNYYFIAAAAS